MRPSSIAPGSQILAPHPQPAVRAWYCLIPSSHTGGSSHTHMDNPVCESKLSPENPWKESPSGWCLGLGVCILVVWLLLGWTDLRKRCIQSLEAGSARKISGSRSIVLKEEGPGPGAPTLARGLSALRRWGCPECGVPLAWALGWCWLWFLYSSAISFCKNCFLGRWGTLCRAMSFIAIVAADVAKPLSVSEGH